MVIGLLITMTARVEAVDFEEQLKSLAETNGKGYISPFATTFGTGINSGFYHTAKPHKGLPLLGFDVSVKMSYISIPDKGKTFTWDFGDTSYQLDLPNNGGILELDFNNIYPDRETPTVFGDENPTGLEPTGAAEEIRRAATAAGIDLSDADIESLTQNIQPFPTVSGLDLDALPLMIPQVSIGLFKKSKVILFRETEVMLRFLPSIDFGDIKDINLFGVGIKHELTQHIPVPTPFVNVSAQFAYQQLNIGDLLESTHIAYNLHASVDINLIVFGISPYIGLGMESSNLKVSYVPEGGNPATDEISFDIDGDNSFRMTGGLRIRWTLITFNADYSLGEYNAASLGIGFTFR